MEIKLKLNGRNIVGSVEADTVLLDFLRENPDPTDDEIRAFLAGNLCRCSGYDGQLRGIRNYLNSRKA